MLSVEDAIAVTLTAFIGKTDKGGTPYVLHCLRVMARSWPVDNRMQAAVMHDVVEDSNITLDDLRAMGFSDHVLTVLDLLTHRKDQSYDEYIARIADSYNLDAVAIKIDDLEDNMNLSRLRRPPNEKDLARVEKYRKAKELLHERLIDILAD